MKWVIIVFIFLSNLSFCTYIEDEIISVIYDEQQPIVITKHDLNKRNVMGQKQTLTKIKKDASMCRDARNLNVIIPDEAIERALVQIQKQNNIPQEQFIQLLQADGLSLEDYRTELKTLYTVNAMLDFRVHSRATVTYESIIRYYQENPLYHDSQYYIASKIVPIQKKHIITNVIQKLESKPASYWQNAFWIKSSELAADKYFIKDMKIGSVHVFNKNGVYTFFKLLDKKEPTLIELSERYDTIVSLLKKPLEKELEQKYTEELFANAIIVDF